MSILAHHRPAIVGETGGTVAKHCVKQASALGGKAGMPFSTANVRL